MWQWLKTSDSIEVATPPDVLLFFPRTCLAYLKQAGGTRSGSLDSIRVEDILRKNPVYNKFFMATIVKVIEMKNWEETGD